MTTATRRHDLIDALRGVALLGMIVFHAVWDLHIVGLSATPIAEEPFWSGFARVVAGSFLLIAGASLVLATRNGIVWPVFWRRVAIVGGAAALVSVATWFVFPAQWVFFGILHQIALGSILALPFLRAPLALVIAVAAAAIAAPFLVSHPIFDEGPLLIVGLGTFFPSAVDYVPILPWTGLILAGIAAMRIALARGAEARLEAWRASALPARLLVLGGRHSLLVYLVHQPVLIALLTGLAWTIQGGTRDAFVAECEQACRGTGTTAQVCTAACRCTADIARREGLMDRILMDRATDADRQRLTAIANACAGEARPR
jgi:uncharacterized membrane protein